MKNWKTTLSGAAGAVLFAVTGTHDWKHLLGSAAIALLGYFASDAQAAPAAPAPPKQ